MFSLNFKNAMPIAAAALGLLFIGSGAQAVTCTDLSIENNVTTNSGCEIGNAGNDTLNPPQVNTDAMFGYTDWSFIAKDDDLNGTNQGVTSALTITNVVSGADGPISGNWQVNYGPFAEILFVIKGGQGQTIEPDQYVGYLLKKLVDGTTGTFTSPFSNTKNQNATGISHITIYGRGDGGGVGFIPVPAGLPLLLTAMGLGGFMSWRKRKSA